MMFARKGVAIPYIIALVIGIIVVVIVVYWIYRTTTHSTLNLQECKSRYITWCSNCAQMNWQWFYCMPEGVLECKKILQDNGLKVPEGDCDAVLKKARCGYDDVKKDCAALGVCLNNDKCK